MKQTGNVLGLIFAWLLSIVLVFMLLVTPITTSVLSLLNANTLTNVVVEVLSGLAAQVPDNITSADYRLERLAEVSTEDAPESAEQNADSISALLEKYLKAPIGAAELEKVMSSNTVKEILKTYTGDLTGVLTGQQKVSALDAQKLKSIVNDNIDEVVRIVQEIKPDLTEGEKQSLKSEILKVVDEKAEEIIQMLPKPEEIKEQILENAPEVGSALQILEKKKTIELALVGVLAVLSGLIFLCRLEGFRGFRWLAVDLFIGGGFNGLVWLGLTVSSAAITGILSENALGTVVGAMLTAFSKALLLRAIIILAVGGALLAAYILIKKKCPQKVTVNTEE